MGLKYALASATVLGSLFAFVFVIFLVLMNFVGQISFPVVILLTILFNLIMWLLSPVISDFIHKTFYNIHFYRLEELISKSGKSYYKEVKRVCDKYGIAYPKIGIIDDMNPTAFTYGSTKNNARVVFTKGLLEFLDDDEVTAVLLHEMGHVKHQDFILMTIASTLLQILYEVYVMTRYSHNSDNDNKSGYLVVIGIISYIFYLIGTYMVLFLSRVREYFADEFSAKECKNPNHLSSALVKIAYGIASVPDDDKTARLLKSTRSMGIFDFKAASEVGQTLVNSKKNSKILSNAILFDVVSPWAGLMELGSTHPLIGKRIRALEKLTDKPHYGVAKIISDSKANMGRLWSEFLTDLLFVYLPKMLFLSVIGSALYAVLMKDSFGVLLFGGFLFGYVITSIIRINYMYPKKFVGTTIADSMSDLYVSPVRGKPVVYDGSVIGRGAAGFIFSEDMMYRDSTGIIYINYESKIPLIGNMLFGMNRLAKLVDRPSKVTGWFMRGAAAHVELNDFSSKEDKFTSGVVFWQYFWVILISFLTAALGFGLIF